MGEPIQPNLEEYKVRMLDTQYTKLSRRSHQWYGSQISYKKASTHHPQNALLANATDSSMYITVQGVAKLLSNLKPNKACGYMLLLCGVQGKFSSFFVENLYHLIGLIGDMECHESFSSIQTPRY